MVTQRVLINATQNIPENGLLLLALQRDGIVKESL